MEAKIIDAKIIDETNNRLDSQETGNGEEKQFPEGIFEEVKEEETIIEPGEKKFTGGKPFNLTRCIDTFVGVICMFLFKTIEPHLLELSEDEVTYFSELEEKCGIKFEIGSPWWYFGALSVCYMGKIKALIMYNRIQKADDLAAEKEAEKEALEADISVPLANTVE